MTRENKFTTPVIQRWLLTMVRKYGVLEHSRGREPGRTTIIDELILSQLVNWNQSLGTMYLRSLNL